MNKLIESERLKICAVGCGCGCAALGYLLLPTVIGSPVLGSTVAMGTVISPEGSGPLKKYLKSSESFQIGVRVGERFDQARAGLSFALLVLIEGSAAFPAVAPHLNEVSKQVPDLVPVALALMALVYGGSWLMMRRQRKDLEKRITS